MEEEEIGAIILAGVVDVAVRDGQESLAFEGVGDGTVAGEIEKRTGRAQLAKLLGVEVGLQLAQGKGADAAGVHPRNQQGKNVGVSQLRKGFLDFKRSDIHNHMLA